MSMPTFPKNDPPLTREGSLNEIISSIAAEELSLSHLLNVEGEKLQYVLGTLPGLDEAAALEEVLQVNQSVKDTLSSVMEQQMALSAKLSAALKAPTAPGPAGPTGTFLIGKCAKLQNFLQYDNKIYHITWNTALWRLWAVFSYIINDKKEVSKWKKIKPSSPLTKDSPRSQTPEYRSKSNWMLLALKHWIALWRNALPEM